MRYALAGIIGISLSACVSAHSATSAESMFLKASTTRNVLTAAEIVASKVSDAYQAVTQLRPDFLRRRQYTLTMAQTKPVAMSVYLDDLPFGNVESLRSVPLERVRIIRYLTPFEAELRWGGSHPTGAILVTTVKR